MGILQDQQKIAQLNNRKDFKSNPFYNQPFLTVSIVALLSTNADGSYTYSAYSVNPLDTTEIDTTMLISPIFSYSGTVNINSIQVISNTVGMVRFIISGGSSLAGSGYGIYYAPDQV